MSTILNLNACPWKRLFPCAFDVRRGQKGVKVASTSVKTLVQQGGHRQSVWCSRRVRFPGRAPRIRSMFPKDFLRTTSAHRLREAIGGHRQGAYLRILFQDEPEVGSPNCTICEPSDLSFQLVFESRDQPWGESTNFLGSRHCRRAGDFVSR